jgi:hypothetical protein
VKLEKKGKIGRLEVDGMGLTMEVGKIEVNELSKMDVFIGEDVHIFIINAQPCLSV